MKFLILSALHLFIFASSIVFAQSGRVVNGETPAEETPKAVAAIKNEYPPCVESGAIVELYELPVEEFSKKMNELGHCGYRLINIDRSTVCGLTEISKIKVSGVFERVGGNKYEYNWFVAQTPGEAQRILNLHGENGFYFRQKMSFVAGRCTDAVRSQSDENKTPGGLGTLMNMGLGFNGALFITEGKVGESKKNEYRIIDGRVSGKKNEPVENKKILDDYVARGFRPVDVWFLNFTTQNVLIMEKDEAVKPAGEYIFIYQLLGINKKMTELGREGFQPVHIGFTFALLHRMKNEPTGMTYDTVQNWKDIQKRLPEWKRSGIEYIDVGTSDYYSVYDPFDGRWLFAVPNQPNGETNATNDFVFLHEPDFFREYITRNNIKVSSKNPLSKAQQREIRRSFNAEMNRLVAEGYRLIYYGKTLTKVAFFARPQKRL